MLRYSYSVTRSFTGEFVSESAVTDTEVSKADIIKDYDLEIERLHRSIVESGVMDEDLPVEEAIADYEIENELAEPNRTTTTFAHELTVETEIVDTMLATAKITDTHPLGTEVVRTKQLENAAATQDEPEEEAALDDDDETVADSTTDEEAASTVTITDDAIGHSVFNADGEEIAMVAEVEEKANALFVDPEPGIAGRIRSALGWGDADDDYRFEPDAIRRISDDQVELNSPKELN